MEKGEGSSFILSNLNLDDIEEAYSKRDSNDNRRGSSDPDARVGRDGNKCNLGYKAHISALRYPLTILQ